MSYLFCGCLCECKKCIFIYTKQDILQLAYIKMKEEKKTSKKRKKILSNFYQHVNESSDVMLSSLIKYLYCFSDFQKF